MALLLVEPPVLEPCLAATHFRQGWFNMSIAAREIHYPKCLQTMTRHFLFAAVMAAQGVAVCTAGALSALVLHTDCI